MKKLSKREMIIKVATSLRNSYGNTLVEDGTDLMMAVDLIRDLKDTISFAKTEMIDRAAFIKWRSMFLANANMAQDFIKEEAEKDWDRIKRVRFR